MINVESYYNHICNEWGVQPTSPTYTGYEHVEKQLKSYTKERWLVASEEGRQQIEDEVFDIYRNVFIIMLSNSRTQMNVLHPIWPPGQVLIPQTIFKTHIVKGFSPET